MLRSAACGSGVGSASSLSISSLSTSATRGVFDSQGRRMRFPAYVRLRQRPSFPARPLFLYMHCRVNVSRGGRTCFPAALTHLLEDLHSKVNTFIAHVATDPIWCLTSFIQGVVRVVSKVVSHLGGCGFPAGRAINEIDDHQHTDRTTLPTRMPPLVPERGGASPRPPAEPWTAERHGPPAGAHSGKVPRPPEVVDSSTALAFNEAESRGWIDNPLLEHSKECERDRTNSPGLFLHGRPQEVGPSGWCGDCGGSTS